jgi:serpin B
MAGFIKFGDITPVWGTSLRTWTFTLCLTLFLLVSCAAEDRVKPKSPRDVVQEVIGDRNTTAMTEPVSNMTVVEANNRFAIDFYHHLIATEEGNMFFSPWSISTATAMLYEGARGETAREIQSVFHFPTDDTKRRNSFTQIINQLNPEDDDYELSTANAFWAQKDYPFLPEYATVVENVYKGQVTNVDFIRNSVSERKKINEWVEEQTNNKIKDLFPEGSINSYTRFVLANAIYFKGTWVEQFEEEQTKEEEFKVNDTTKVKVPMMGRTDSGATFNYAENEELQILEMLYEGDRLSMLVLLPKEDSIELLEASLTIDLLTDLKGNLRKTRVDVFIPKFTFNTKYDLKDKLPPMGMQLVFTPRADLSGFAGPRELFITDGYHQAFVLVNEEGTEAAAATGYVGGVTSEPPPVPVFRADHPFIFIIQERESGNILFIGKVVNPSINLHKDSSKIQLQEIEEIPEEKYCEKDEDCTLGVSIGCGCDPCLSLNGLDPEVIALNKNYRKECPPLPEGTGCAACSTFILIDENTVIPVCTNNRCEKVYIEDDMT